MSIPKIKEEWDSSVPVFRNKMSNAAVGKSGNSFSVNPFLDRNGNLVNPYIDYQRALDSPGVSDRAKRYIAEATGLLPSETVQTSTIPTPTANYATQEVADYVPEEESAVAEEKKLTGGNSIVSAAEKYIGTPYVWGGQSASDGGMDCSGFVYNALKDAGYNVGRTTAQGYRNLGTAVNKADMQAGDLVFFGSGGNASHVGIYIGNGQMIHSSGGSKNTAANPGKGVTVTNVNYRNDFIEARRY